ncbi:MAG: hypothetical protein ACX94B_01270 [Henriciella sp.]|nr:hypothetical protein [Hyphomonadaceae bacterium]
MKDIVFYPVIVAIVAVMVVSALYRGWLQPQCGPFGGANGPEDYSLIILKGQDLCRMQGFLGYELNLEDEVLTIRADQEAVFADPQQNAHFELGPDLETVYAGHKIRVSLTVRPTEGAGAQAFEFNYSAGKAGNSGWIRFDLKPEWDTYTAEIDVPRKLLENNVALDYLAVRPVVPEKTRGIELSEIRFRRLGRW